MAESSDDRIESSMQYTSCKCQHGTGGYRGVQRGLQWGTGGYMPTCTYTLTEKVPFYKYKYSFSKLKVFCFIRKISLIFSLKMLNTYHLVLAKKVFFVCEYLPLNEGSKQTVFAGIRNIFLIAAE